MIHRELLLARPHFVFETQRWAMQGAFVNYTSDASFATRRGDRSLANVARHLRHVQDDLVNIGALMVRLAITTEHLRAGRVPQDQWFAFTTIDIDHFHIILRSALDHVAEVIVAASTHPRSMPGRDGHRSFRELQDWLRKDPTRAAIIGNDLAALIDAAVWFPELGEIRDDNVHRGARTLSFDDGIAGILFQVFNGSLLHSRIEHMGVMHRSNLVDFCRYGALIFARLFNLLEALARVLSSQLPCEHVGIGDGVHRGPWEAFVRWTDAVLSPNEPPRSGPWADISPMAIITMRFEG